MLLDIRKLLRPGAEPETGQITADFSQRDFYGYTVPTPVEICYTARPMAMQVQLTVTVSAQLAAECARCLSPATQALATEKSCYLTAEDWADEFPELPFQPDGRLDLDELAYGEIVMEAPGAILCREDCPGLCQRCGKPAAECACPDEPEGDPRLQVLRQLLTTNEDDVPST